MSRHTSYEIRCPRCGREQTVTLCEAINVKTDAGLRDQLMANQLNVVACPGCSVSFRVDKPLLYQDPDRRISIHLMPAKADGIEAAERQFSEWMTQLHSTLPAGVNMPAVHLVFSRIEMVERIFLLEAGLNERIIEYIKYLIYTKNANRLDPTRKALLFDAHDSTETSFCFVVQDVESQKLESLLEYSREAYQSLCEMFDRDEQTPSLMELFPGPGISARRLLLRDFKPGPSPQETADS
jgi:hypothetical protein